MAIEYYFLVTRKMWEHYPEFCVDNFRTMLSHHYPDTRFDIEARLENNLLGPNTTVALLATEVE